MTTSERTAWLETRKSGIGSSDSYNLIGLGFSDDPMEDVLRVYRSKVEPVDPRLPDSGPLRAGLDMEPMLTQKYAETMGCELTSVEMVRHPDRPWQFASVDRIRPDGRRVELKSPGMFGDDYGEPGTADVPKYVFAQVQHQLTVVGAESMDVFALARLTWETRMYRVDLDRDFAAWLTSVEERFMREHVQPRVVPGREWLEFAVQRQPEVLRVIRPGTIDLGDPAASLLAQRARLAKIRDDADAECKRLTQQVEGMMGDSERAVAGSWKLRRSVVEAARVEAYTRKGYVRLTISGGRG